MSSLVGYSTSPGVRFPKLDQPGHESSGIAHGRAGHPMRHVPRPACRREPVRIRHHHGNPGAAETPRRGEGAVVRGHRQQNGVSGRRRRHLEPGRYHDLSASGSTPGRAGFRLALVGRTSACGTFRPIRIASEGLRGRAEGCPGSERVLDAEVVLHGEDRLMGGEARLEQPRLRQRRPEPAQEAASAPCGPVPARQQVDRGAVGRVAVHEVA